MQRNQFSDQDLIRLYSSGDEFAFEQLLQRHKSKVYTTIILFVKDNHTADDIFQETFIKIVDMLRSNRYNDEGKFIQWALRIAYNLCIDHFRKNKRQPASANTDSFDIFNVIPLRDFNVEEGLIREQTFTKIRDLIDNLPPEQREVIILRHYADMSFKDIADTTKVSINTALGRMRYALINIRKMMTERQISLQ
jgi:RNA polymerase sigma factor (sigma-70 family)